MNTMSEQSLSKLSAALVAASAEMPAVAFDETNPFLKNRFASLGSVIATARPILAKHGLAIMQFACSDAQGKVGVRTRLIHSSGEYMEESVHLPLHEEKGKSQAQVAGSIITYLRRYAQSALLNLYADEDTDGNRLTPAEEMASGELQQHAGRVQTTRTSPTPVLPTKAPAIGATAQGEAKGSASPQGGENDAARRKAKFLQIIAEKQWGLYAWLYAVSQGWILDTERLEDAPPEKFPKTEGEMAKIDTAIKKMLADAAEHGGISQAEQESYDMAHLEIDPETGQVHEPSDNDEGAEPWMDVVMHFGPDKGKRLIEIDRKKLFGWASNYEPKPFKGRLNPADVALREALDEAKSWLDENR